MAALRPQNCVRYEEHPRYARRVELGVARISEELRVLAELP